MTDEEYSCQREARDPGTISFIHLNKEAMFIISNYINYFIKASGNSLVGHLSI